MGRRKSVPVPAGHQACHRCGDIAPIEAFERVYWRASGRHSSCRPCMAEARDDRAEIKQTIEDMSARLRAPKPQPPYTPPSGPIPPEQRKTAEDFRKIDNARRRQRLWMRK